MKRDRSRGIVAVNTKTELITGRAFNTGNF